MEDLFDFLTQSAFQEIKEHNQTTNTKHVPKAQSTNGKLRDLSSLKLRERLIHLLALKPFTQRELNARLQKDGIRKPEKSLIGNVLAEIAQLSSEEYSLKRCMWNKVKINWSYYTEQERQQLKLRLTPNLSNPTNSNEHTSTFNQISPPIISAAQPIQGETAIEICGKRPCLEYEEPQIKKKRRISTKNIGNKNPCKGTQPDHKQAPLKEPTLQKIQKVSGDGTHKKNSQKEPIAKPASEVAVSDIYKSNQRQESVPEISNLSCLNTTENNQHRKPVIQTNSVVPDRSTYKSSQHQKHPGTSENGQHLEPAPLLNKKVSNKSTLKKSSQKEPVIKKASEGAGTDIYKNNNRQESVPEVASKFSSVDTIENKQHRKTYAVVSGNDAYRSHHHQKPAGTSEKRMILESDLQSNNKVSGTQKDPVVKTASAVAVADIYKNKQRQESAPEIASTFSCVDKIENSQHRKTVPGNDIHKNFQHQRPLGISEKRNNPESALRINNKVSDIHKKSTQKQPVVNVASEISVIDAHKDYNSLEAVPEVALKVSVNGTNDQHKKQILQTIFKRPAVEYRVIEEGNTEASSYDFSSYPTIRSIEQRRQYKYDFERVYKEYFPLRQRVEEVQNILHILPEQLRNVPEGSAECERITNQIFAVTERLNTKEEIGLKRRFDYLEAKLIHIRQRVDDFDQQMLEERAE
uniref:RNA polymerase II elongation factor ELL n=1 Tax=Bactrocera dorsalis TaxID=27457 RepID=A0A034W904_BACDO